jgi:peptide-methionine (S)-S-oxide reductase
MNSPNQNDNVQKITLGGGCFWCTEAIFKELKGVINVVPGYSGGTVENPSYREVCTGSTGHAEVVQITFNPDEISVAEILEIFFMTHDPTTLNRQGPDSGTQYRSVIFYHTEEQRKASENIKKQLDAEKIFDMPIVTELTEYKAFYPAEDYHHNYFEQNREQPYCKFVVNPKIQKFKKIYKDKLKQ